MVSADHGPRWSSSSPAGFEPTTAAVLSHAGPAVWPTTSVWSSSAAAATNTAATESSSQLVTGFSDVITASFVSTQPDDAFDDVTSDDVTVLSRLRKLGVTLLSARMERESGRGSWPGGGYTSSSVGGGDGGGSVGGLFSEEITSQHQLHHNSTSYFSGSSSGGDESRTMEGVAAAAGAATDASDRTSIADIDISTTGLRDFADAAWTLLENVTHTTASAVTSVMRNTTSSRVYQAGLDATTTTTTTVLNLVSVTVEGPSNTTVNDSGEEPLYELKNPVIGVMLALFSLVVIVGNVMVIVAVFRELYLRSVTNYFIVSLAIADVMVGGVVMPFAISHEMTNEVWLYGQEWCDLWHSLDVLASTASILNLCVISLDRYWAITDPINYPTKMSNCKVCLLITLVWLCSAGISFPAIAWWKDVTPPDMPEHKCLFTEDSGYLIVSSLISFYIPTVIMMFVYAKIYRAAMAQSEGIKAGSKVTSNGLRGDDGEVMTLRIHRGGMRSQEEYHLHHHHHHHHHHHNHHHHSNGGSGRGGSTGDLGGSNNNNGHSGGSGGSGGGRGGDCQIQLERSTSDSEGDSPCHSSNTRGLQVSDSSSGGTPRPAKHITKRLRHFAISKKLTKLAREQKAAKTLGIVVGVFIMCWLPFFVTNVLLALCKDCILNPDVLFPVVTWLGYINSGMNPIIYALSMRDFRRAFSKMIFCCCPRYRYQPPYQRPYQHHHNSLSTSSFTAACSDKCVVKI